MESTPLAPALPAGARLFHIGLPKTGTTALQSAAARRRSELLRAGVCYPGRRMNHLYPVCALMPRRMGWRDSGARVPDLHHWTDLVAELDAHPGHRALVSHEFASECNDEQAARFISELGASAYVAITLRSFAAVLSSSWQQYLKTGKHMAFGAWLREILADQPDSPRARHFYRRNDQAVIVERWVAAAGADRVFVVVTDREHPHLLTDAFSDLLDLPRGLLRPEIGEGENRSMSWPEAELVRRVNRTARERRLEWREYELLVRKGMVSRMLRNRRPAPDEPRVTLPAWAAEPAAKIARGYAERVLASGCAVIGNPGALSAPGPVGDLQPADVVPLDAAAEGALGLLSAAPVRDASIDLDRRAMPAAIRRLARSKRAHRWLALHEATPTASSADLVAVAAIRAARQLRRRWRR